MIGKVDEHARPIVGSVSTQTIKVEVRDGVVGIPTATDYVVSVRTADGSWRPAANVQGFRFNVDVKDAFVPEVVVKFSELYGIGTNHHVPTMEPEAVPDPFASESERCSCLTGADIVALIVAARGNKPVANRDIVAAQKRVRALCADRGIEIL